MGYITESFIKADKIERLADNIAIDIENSLIEGDSEKFFMDVINDPYALKLLSRLFLERNKRHEYDMRHSMACIIDCVARNRAEKEVD